MVEGTENMQSHIALHLERFSLFSLPRWLANNGDSADSIGSAAADLNSEGSRAEDLDVPLIFEADVDSDNMRDERAGIEMMKIDDGNSDGTAQSASANPSCLQATSCQDFEFTSDVENRQPKANARSVSLPYVTYFSYAK
jgi:hypothetical protein